MHKIHATSVIKTFFLLSLLGSAIFLIYFNKQPHKPPSNSNTQPASSSLGSPNPTTNQPCSNFFSNTEAGFSLCLPSNFKLSSHSGPGKLALYTATFLPAQQPSPKSDLNISVSRLSLALPYHDKETLDNYLKQSELEITREQEMNLFLSSKERDTITYYSLKSAQNTRKLKAFILKNDLLYELTYSYTLEAEPDGEETFKSILGSFIIQTTDKLISVGALKITSPPNKSSLTPPVTIIISGPENLSVQVYAKSETQTLPLGTATYSPTLDSYTVDIFNSLKGGSYSIAAESIQENGEIYQSTPVSITIKPKR